MLTSAADLCSQVDLKHIDQDKGSNIVVEGIDLKQYYMSVEWDILEIPAKRNEELYVETPYPGGRGTGLETTADWRGICSVTSPPAPQSPQSRVLCILVIRNRFRKFFSIIVFNTEAIEIVTMVTKRITIHC